MDQDELNREVARATGESVDTVNALGFSVLTLTPPWVVVDHRVRLGDLTRQQMRRHLKARENPVRPTGTPKRKAVSGSGSAGAGLARRKLSARTQDWNDLITSFPHPQIRTLTFDKWGA